MKSKLYIIGILIILSMLSACSKIERQTIEVEFSNALISDEKTYGNEGSRFSFYDLSQIKFTNELMAFYGPVGNYNRALGTLNENLEVTNLISLNFLPTGIKRVEINNQAYICVFGGADENGDNNFDPFNPIVKIYNQNLDEVWDLSQVAFFTMGNHVKSVESIHYTNKLIIALSNGTFIVYDFDAESSEEYTIPGFHKITEHIEHVHSLINNFKSDTTHYFYLGTRDYITNSDTYLMNQIYYLKLENSENTFEVVWSQNENIETNNFVDMCVAYPSHDVAIISKTYDYSRPIGDSYWQGAHVTIFKNTGSIIGQYTFNTDYTCRPYKGIFKEQSIIIAAEANSRSWKNDNSFYSTGTILKYDYNLGNATKFFFGDKESSSGFNYIELDQEDNLRLFGYKNLMFLHNPDYNDWYMELDGFIGWYCSVPYSAL